MLKIPTKNDNKNMKKPLRKKQEVERFKVVVGINSLGSSQYPSYSNHIQVFYRLGRSYPNIDFCLVNPNRMSIDRMRNLAAETALDIEAKYLLFLDDDVLVPQPFDFLKKFMDSDADIIAADVLIRGYPFNHMLFRWDKARRGLNQMKTLPKQRGLIDVDAVGFSLCAIKVDLLRKMPKPYFITGLTNTEDIYFCLNARKFHPETTIMADTSIICGHILWPEVIDSYNKKNYKTYFKKQFNPQEEKKSSGDRGLEYYNIVKAGFDNAKKKH